MRCDYFIISLYEINLCYTKKGNHQLFCGPKHKGWMFYFRNFLWRSLIQLYWDTQLRNVKMHRYFFRLSTVISSYDNPKICKPLIGFPHLPNCSVLNFQTGFLCGNPTLIRTGRNKKQIVISWHGFLTYLIFSLSFWQIQSWEHD